MSVRVVSAGKLSLRCFAVVKKAPNEKSMQLWIAEEKCLDMEL